MNNIHEDELDEYIGLALRLSPSHFLPEKYASQSAIPKDVYDIAHKKMKKFLKLELNRLIQSKINEARIDEIEHAESQNVPAGGLHRPSYYAIDPDYAEKRKDQLTKETQPKKCIWGAKYSNASFDCGQPATNGNYCEKHVPDYLKEPRS